MTGPKKSGLIYTKYTYSHYGTYLSLFLCVLCKSASLLNFLGNSVYMIKICVDEEKGLLKLKV